MMKKTLLSSTKTVTLPFLLVSVTTLNSVPASAAIARPPSLYPVGRPTLQCVYESAQYHRVPFQVLLAVNSIERGNTGQKVGNRNGTFDNGAFQINSIHFPRAQRLVSATPYDISSRGCFNADFAAMLLAEAINHPKKQYEDFFTRAAGYHSWTPQYNRVYRAKLIRYTHEWTTWLQNQGLGNTITPLHSPYGRYL